MRLPRRLPLPRPFALPLAVRSALLPGVLALALSACDSETPPVTQVTFGGVTYARVGDAVLTETGGALVVSNIGASGADGVRVDAPAGGLDSLGVAVRPVALPAGSRWGIEAFGTVDGARTVLASARAEATTAGRHRIVVDFAPALGVRFVVFQYLLAGQLVAESPEIPFTPGDGLTGSATLLETAGETDGDPESVHTTRRGGVILVGTDYGGGGNRLPAGGSASRKLGGDCTGVLITAPFTDEPICADYVISRPLLPGGVFPAVTSAEITGRAIGEFAITGGTLE